MREERDFAGIEPLFFSTSQVGQAPPRRGRRGAPSSGCLRDQGSRELGCYRYLQGSAYTERMLPKLRQAGYEGYWIDAASAKRMDPDSVIILDPVNRPQIERALDRGVKNLIGGNCTVSAMLMALAGLFRQGWVEWLSSMTYQAASGAGARQMRELVVQMRALGQSAAPLLETPTTAALELDRVVRHTLRSDTFPTEAIGAPLAGSLIPWIDRAMDGGETREEWKGYAETNKILELDPPVPVDGICVRVGAMRCHSQALTIKLKQDVPLDEIEAALSEGTEWTEVIENSLEATREKLTPVYATGTLKVPVGRVRKLRMGPEFLGAMTVADQLLWGAAEPLRRMLRILRER